MQEVVSIYPALSPPTLSPGASNRVCNALALLQVSLCINEAIVAQFIGSWLLLLLRAYNSFRNNISDFSWFYCCSVSHRTMRPGSFS
jgi:hypothetical protein